MVMVAVGDEASWPVSLKYSSRARSIAVLFLVLVLIVAVVAAESLSARMAPR